MLEKIFEEYNLDFSKVEKGVYKNNNLSKPVLKDHVERNKVLNGYVIIVDDNNDTILYIFDDSINIDIYYKDLQAQGYNNIYITVCEYYEMSDDFIGTLFLSEELERIRRL